jgi:hypothetical protein
LRKKAISEVNGIAQAALAAVAIAALLPIAAWSGVAHYRRSRAGYNEFVCAENNANIWTGKSYPIPVAKSSDF